MDTAKKIEFANRVLSVMTEDKDWGSETMDFIQQLAFELGLADADEETGQFKAAESVDEFIKAWRDGEQQTTSVVVVGNPIDGVDIIGPFQSSEQANEWADNSPLATREEWWCVELQQDLDQIDP